MSGFKTAVATPGPARAPSPGGGWRTGVVALCVILLGVTAPLSIVALWTHREIGDTDRYVAMVSPLARDAAVQDAVATRVADEVTARLGAGGVTLDDTVRGAIATQVRRAVATDAFGTIGDEANRAAHAQVIALLTGDSDVAEVRGDAVVLDLAAFIDLIRGRLVDAGLTMAAHLPTVHVQLTLFRADHLSTLQRVFRLLSHLAYVLPLVALALLAVALGLAHDRRRTVLVAALSVAASMLLLWLALPRRARLSVPRNTCTSASCSSLFVPGSSMRT